MSCLQPSASLSFLLAMVSALSTPIGSISASRSQHSASSHRDDHHRQQQPESRFLPAVSTGSHVYGELLVSVPLSVFLPSVMMKRWLGDPDDHDDDRSAEAESRQPDSTMETVMSMLGIEDLHCQKHLICTAIQQAKRHEPLSNIFYLILSDNSTSARGTPSQPDRHHVQPENWPHYRQAFVAGQQSTPCHSPLCSCGPDLVDYKMLQYWQKLSHFTPLTIPV